MTTETTGSKAGYVPPDGLTRPWMARFLEQFHLRGSIAAASKAVGIFRSTAYDNRKTDEAFARAWEEIDGALTDELEISSLRRAIDGFEEPVFQGGDQVGTRVVFSATREIFHLKSRNPEKYNRVPVGLGEAMAVADRARELRMAFDATAAIVSAPTDHAPPG